MQGPSGGAFHPLCDQLHTINHWWDPTTTPHRSALEVATAPMFHRADFFRMLEAFATPAATPSVWGVAGPAGVGKTTVLAQAIRLFTDDRLQRVLQAVGTAQPSPESPSPDERHLAWAVNKYHNQQVSADGVTDLVNELDDRRPTDLLYLPLAVDPAYQITPLAQLTAAVDRYEQEVLEGSPAQREHLIIIDDIHLCYPAAWAPTIVDLIEAAPARRVILTGGSLQTLEGALRGAFDTASRTYDTAVRLEPMLPMKFRDFLQRRHPVTEGRRETIPTVATLGQVLRGATTDPADPDTGRLRGAPLLEALRTAVALEDPEPLTQTAAAVDRRLAAIDPELPAQIMAAQAQYRALGGFTALRLPEDVYRASEAEFSAFLDGETVAGSTLAELHEATLRAVMATIREEAPTLDALTPETISGLPRLFAWAAHELPVESIAYAALIGDDHPGEPMFDVDRRTLREKYFASLEAMILLTPIAQYGDAKPRDLRMAIRDVGLAAAIKGLGHEVSRADAETDRRLQHMLLFDHIKRLSYLVNDRHDPNRGVVRFWEDGDTAVPFIIKVGGSPVPIVATDTETDVDAAVTACDRFIRSQSPESDADVHDYLRLRPDRRGADPARLLELTLGGIGEWPGVQSSAYHGSYEPFEWGSEGVVHHRIHDGPARVGIVLTGQSDPQVRVTDGGAPIACLPRWSFLAQV
jgi:hypothetical protein